MFTLTLGKSLLSFVLKAALSGRLKGSDTALTPASSLKKDETFSFMTRNEMPSSESVPPR